MNTLSKYLEIVFKNELRKAGIRILPNMIGPVDCYNRLIGAQQEDVIGIEAHSFSCDFSKRFSDVVDFCKQNNVKEVAFYSAFIKSIRFEMGDDLVSGMKATVFDLVTFQEKEVEYTQDQIDRMLNSCVVRFWYNNHTQECWILPNSDILNSTEIIAK